MGWRGKIQGAGSEDASAEQTPSVKALRSSPGFPRLCFAELQMGLLFSSRFLFRNHPIAEDWDFSTASYFSLGFLGRDCRHARPIGVVLEVREL